MAAARVKGGAGCTLEDILATWLVFGLGLSVAGPALPYEYLFDYTFAFALGIAFQFFSIRPMRPELGRGQVVRAALKARRTFEVEQRWLCEPDLTEWMAASRLNLLRGLPERAGDSGAQVALKRFRDDVGPATERLAELEASAT